MEIKRPIVESKNPPSNKEVWWFDTNNEQLKRYRSGNWTAVSNTISNTNLGSAYGTVKYTTEDGTKLNIYSAILSLPNEVIFSSNEVPKDAFKSTKIEKAVLENVKTIKTGAFRNSSLSAIHLTNVESIEDDAFARTELDALHLPDSLVDIAPTALLQNVNHKLSQVTGKYTIDNTFVVKDSKLLYTALRTADIEDEHTDIYIPSSVKVLNEYSLGYLHSSYYEDENEEDAYYGWRIHIPDSVEVIRDGAFLLSSAGIGAFYGKFASDNHNYLIDDKKLICIAAANLKSIEIPDGITSIAPRAGQKAKITKSIYIPSSVTTIGDGCFYDVQSLEEVYVKALTPPVLGSNVFDLQDTANTINAKIYVPRDSVDAYKEATNWSSYANNIEGCDFN